jgi:hypothetical protein
MQPLRPITTGLDGVGLPTKDLQELWFATRRRDWTSLAVTPAHAGGSAMPVAEALRQMSQLIKRPARLVQADNLDLTDVATLVTSMSMPRSSAWSSTVARSTSASLGQSSMEHGGDELLIVAVEPVVVNPLVLPLVLATDAVLLVMEQGKTDLASAQHTIDLIGREKLLGCVLLTPKKK